MFESAPLTGTCHSQYHLQHSN